MKFPLSCLAALGILCVGGSFAQDSWVTEGFEQFSRGTFGNAGQNLYVSKACRRLSTLESQGARSGVVADLDAARNEKEHDSHRVRLPG